MKIILIKLLIAGVLFMFCNTKLLAQDSTVDSATEDTTGVTPPPSLGDTVLNRYEVETDSMQQYGQDRDFAYMKYLDSLLRKTKELTVDTFSINNAPGSKQDTRKNSRSVNNTPRINIFSQPIVKVILWIMAIFLIGFIIYKLFLGENFFRRNRSYNDISDTQKEDENISDPSAYDRLIARAVINKNYRMAIRYSYLQTLQMLAGSGLLQFSADKTNYQYVNELHGKPYQNDFAAITLNYEYVWYGKFDIGEDVYNRLAVAYKSFHQKL
ncbi:MAG: hypothetical protein JWO92_1507 [Chitinophagaceae bacterium]|nr:hypothetical protein [Chitinophagaceae bacterium]